MYLVTGSPNLDADEMSVPARAAFLVVPVTKRLVRFAALFVDLTYTHLTPPQ